MLRLFNRLIDDNYSDILLSSCSFFSLNIAFIKEWEHQQFFFSAFLHCCPMTEQVVVSLLFQKEISAYLHQLLKFFLHRYFLVAQNLRFFFLFLTFIVSFSSYTAWLSVVTLLLGKVYLQFFSKQKFLNLQY